MSLKLTRNESKLPFVASLEGELCASTLCIVNILQYVPIHEKILI